jgi:hypothetical protein
VFCFFKTNRFLLRAIDRLLERHKFGEMGDFKCPLCVSRYMCQEDLDFHFQRRHPGQSMQDVINSKRLLDVRSNVFNPDSPRLGATLYIGTNGCKDDQRSASRIDCIVSRARETIRLYGGDSSDALAARRRCWIFSSVSPHSSLVVNAPVCATQGIYCCTRQTCARSVRVVVQNQRYDTVRRSICAIRVQIVRRCYWRRLQCDKDRSATQSIVWREFDAWRSSGLGADVVPEAQRRRGEAGRCGAGVADRHRRRRCADQLLDEHHREIRDNDRRWCVEQLGQKRKFEYARFG